MFGFKYVLLNPRSLPQTHVALFNQVYDHWIKAYSENQESILNCDQVGIILFENSVVGFQLFKSFDLRLTAV